MVSTTRVFKNKKCAGLLLFIFVLLTSSRIWYSVLHESKNPCTACTAPCTLEYINSIEDLEQYTQELDICGSEDSVNLLKRIYKVNVLGSPISIPKPLKNKLNQWLLGDINLISKANRQKVVQIRNRFTKESSHYNPMRAMRPNVQGSNSSEYVRNLIMKAEKSCDFCKPLLLTAEETWGRIRTKTSLSGANVFRLVGPNNAIILADRHNVLELSAEELADMFDCAEQWFKKVNSLNKDLIFPMLVWDFFPKAGASQIHPHFQVWLDKEYSGQFLTHFQAAQLYRIEYGEDYWTDLISLHLNLGLGFKSGETVVFTPLDSHRDREVMVVGDRVDATFIKLFYAAIKLHQAQGNFCLSVGMSWPSLLGSSYPAVARIGYRGDCTVQYSDMSSVDVYAFYSINSNPTHFIHQLKNFTMSAQL
ncbi:uncharacterized protein LOC111707970 [Eurytemora carolleeae]|uniref:uncharacterized protein LOC111707970 n=1 Tax=Eurytemora carolleeae TaxID=1294199 RepID=UPI000C75F185|nr:uncharacterized protein LOC111707970 [Eurytemora carolleeae]|eukprot:XP_023336936.1 uncharacterized protein LOC111707970 [Eurytemora affinis]